MNFTASQACVRSLNVMPCKTTKFKRIDEKLNSTLHCGRGKVEYKFFIEVIRPAYANRLTNLPGPPSPGG